MTKANQMRALVAEGWTPEAAAKKVGTKTSNGRSAVACTPRPPRAAGVCRDCGGSTLRGRTTGGSTHARCLPCQVARELGR